MENGSALSSTRGAIAGTRMEAAQRGPTSATSRSPLQWCAEENTAPKTTWARRSLQAKTTTEAKVHLGHAATIPNKQTNKEQQDPQALGNEAAAASDSKSVEVTTHKRKSPKQKTGALPQNPQVPGNGAVKNNPSEVGTSKKKRKIPTPSEGTEAPVASDTAPRPWKPQRSVGFQNSERNIPKPKVPELKARWNEGRKKTYVAVVEFFAGLRTTHLAAKVLEEVCIVMSHAAENANPQTA